MFGDKFIQKYLTIFIVLFSFGAYAGETQNISPSVPNDFLFPVDDIRESLGSDPGNGFDQYFPGMEDHIQKVISELEYLRIIQNEKSLKVEARIKPSRLLLQIHEYKDVEEGSVYAIDLGKNIGLEVAIRLEELKVENIKGVKFLVNMPWIPDGIYPQSFQMNAKDQLLKTHFEVFWGLLDIIGEVKVKEHQFSGIMIGDTIRENLRSIVNLFLCGIFCTTMVR